MPEEIVKQGGKVVGFTLPKIAKASAQTNVSGVATILIKIPSAGRRVVSGGIWFANKHQDDKVSVTLVDHDNIYGGGVDYVVDTFDDTDMDSTNQGSFIPYPLGYLGTDSLANVGVLPAGLYVKIVGTKGGVSLADTMYANVTWEKDA